MKLSFIQKLDVVDAFQWIIFYVLCCPVEILGYTPTDNNQWIKTTDYVNMTLLSLKNWQICKNQVTLLRLLFALLLVVLLNY